MTSAGQQAFLYYFTYPPKGKRAGYRAYHGLELNFIAGVFPKSRWGEPEDEDRKLVEIMSGYWTQFARTGNPNRDGLTAWPAYDSQKDVYLEIGREVKVRPIHHVEKFVLFERSLQTRVAEYQIRFGEKALTVKPTPRRWCSSPGIRGTRDRTESLPLLWPGAAYAGFRARVLISARCSCRARSKELKDFLQTGDLVETPARLSSQVV